MTTKELRKGDKVMLVSGWEAIIADNRDGVTRFCQVFGDYTEYGSVYSHEIVAKIGLDGSWTYIEYTDKQLKLKKQVESFGF